MRPAAHGATYRRRGVGRARRDSRARLAAVALGWDGRRKREGDFAREDDGVSVLCFLVAAGRGKRSVVWLD